MTNFTTRALARLTAARDGLQSLIESTELGMKLKLVRLQTDSTDRYATWTCSDGRRVPVRTMSDSHLFYAIAKARRGEYPDSYSRKTGVEALEREALRRLAGKVAGVAL
jgi:hypothetical protein